MGEVIPFKHPTAKSKKLERKERVTIIKERQRDKLARKHKLKTKVKSKKKCVSCGQIKPSEKFPTNENSSDGKASYCTDCQNGLNARRMNNNLTFKLKHHMAARIIKQVDDVPEEFLPNMHLYLGYKVKDLKVALNKDLKQREGITLKEAFSKGYHLDHIKPLSLFPVNSINDQSFKDCWAMSNLMMISAEDNLAKGAKYESSEGTNE